MPSNQHCAAHHRLYSVSAWLKLLGTADRPVPEQWAHDRPDLLKAVAFGGDEPPADISTGDRLVYYAVGSGRFFAVAEITSEHPYERTITHEWEAQWPWMFDVRILAKKRRLSEAPSVLELGPTPDRHHKGHVPLSAEQADKAERVLG